MSLTLFTWLKAPGHGQFAKHHLNTAKFNSSPISPCAGGAHPALPRADLGLGNFWQSLGWSWCQQQDNEWE